VSGALALVAAGALLSVGSLRVAAVVSPRSTATFLLAAYVLAWAQLVVLLWALSLFAWVTWWGLLAGLALVCAAACWDTRDRSDALARIVDAGGALRQVFADPLCAVLGTAVAAAFGYAVALGLATPQNDFDTLVDHLWRAGLWMQNHAVGYPDCSCAPYINAYPPHGEMGALATMALGGSDRYVALVQASAYVALAIGVVGVARRLGLGRREALLGSLLVATLPVIALQASTAQNDLVVAAFLVAAVAFLLERGRATPWLAGAATALAVGTKVTALIGIPLLAAVALLAPSLGRRGARLAAVVVGSVAGSYWYVVNWEHTGSWDGGFPYEHVDHAPLPTIARALRSGIQLIELPGAVGRDRWLYAVAAAVLLVGAAVLGARRGWRAAVGWGAVASLVALAPVLVPDVRRYADEGYLKLWRAVGRDDLAVEVGRDITRSASNVTWYGPLGAALVVGGVVLAVFASRRGVPGRLATLFALAPAYWLVALAAVLFYQDAAGRFLMAPVALAGALTGLVGRTRPLAWGLAGVAVTALALAILNDTKRPSGLALLERPAPESYWSMPRWRAQGDEVHIPDLIRYVDEQVPDDARVALGITPGDAAYVVFGPRLDRRLDLLRPGEADAPRATWALVSPSGRDALAPRLCGAWRRLPARPSGWEAYRRVRDRC
jgi:4-amino-4-deoxy-L-arabinose transferase-like glycosyltransferase